jgi:hypothetical protein
MALRLSRGLWFVSMLGLLAALLFVYAALPEDVIVLQDGADFIYAGREIFFYACLVCVTLINALVFFVSSVFKNDEPLKTWFNGLVVVLNIFFIVAFFLINAVNSNEKFDYAKIGFVIYGSVVLIAVWAISWPIYLLIRKFSGKPTV